MPTRRSAAAFALLLVLSSAGTAAFAQADEAIVFYRASWAGLPAAKIRFMLSEVSADYRGEIAIETEGLARWLTRFRGSA